MVEEAIRDLTSQIGAPTRAGIPAQDRRRVVETLQVLRDHGHKFDSELIRRLATDNRWSDGAVDEIGSISGRVLERKKFVLTGHSLASTAYENWASVAGGGIETVSGEAPSDG